MIARILKIVITAGWVDMYLLPLLLLSCASAYKIAIFAPDMANSQILFNSRVAEELAKAGHDVTVYFIHMYDIKKKMLNPAPKPRMRYITINATHGVDYGEMEKLQSTMAFGDFPIWDSRIRAMFAFFGEMYKACERVVQNDYIMKEIEREKYDIAFAHMYNYCPIGIIEKAKIPTWIWLSSGALTDQMAEAVGVPLPPSYCQPMLMDASDEMSFPERVKSFLATVMMKLFMKSMTINKETKVFRDAYGQDFPDLYDVSRKAPLVMVNSNELYDFARPTLHKVVNIGGLGLKKADAKPLKGEFEKRVARAKGHFVFTFGSIAPMRLMPDEWKDAYFNAFAQFPDVEFFVRYEDPELIQSSLPKNVYADKWLPQTDLLQHPKALGLITHGGYNSLQEALHAAVPLLATALFGDQYRNVNLAEKLGVGINMRKADVSQEFIAASIKRLIDDTTLKENALRIQSMISTKPVSAETLLVKWTEFAAKHKNLDNLVPAGNNLPLLVYHSVDVIAFLSAVVLVVAYLAFALIRCTCNILLCKQKQKRD